MSVTTKAIDSIREMIRSGQLVPGDRLPPEQELADELGVSRGSLREAVRALSQINVLDVRRGDGTYVASLAPSELLAGLVFAMELLQGTDLDEVLEVRQLLLPPAAALAAQRVRPEQLDRMREVIARLEHATDPDELQRLHGKFAFLVYDATGNETLASFLRALRVRGENVSRAWLSADPSRPDVAVGHQKMMLDALERGDSEMARSVSVIQVERRRRWIERLRSEAAAAEAAAVDGATADGETADGAAADGVAVDDGSVDGVETDGVDIDGATVTAESAAGGAAASGR